MGDADKKSKEQRPDRGKWLSEPRRIARGTRRAEEDVMRAFREGRRVTGSGSLPVARGQVNKHVIAMQPFGSTRRGRSRSRTEGGDGISRLYFVEHKRTRTTAYSVQREDLTLLRSSAEDVGRVPLFVISFENPQVLRMRQEARAYLDWALLPASAFRARMDRGTLYQQEEFVVSGKSFGWTRTRMRESLRLAASGGAEPLVLIHFTPEGMEAEWAMETGCADVWALLPLKEALILEERAL